MLHRRVVQSEQRTAGSQVYLPGVTRNYLREGFADSVSVLL